MSAQTSPVDVLEELRRIANDEGDVALRAVRCRVVIADLILFADNAEKALRNAVTAGQIHAGNLHYADDLRAALTSVGGA